MEFENWQVSNTMRELVRQENVKHELSLLAAQQEKVRRISCVYIYFFLNYHFFMLMNYLLHYIHVILAKRN